MIRGNNKKIEVSSFPTKKIVQGRGSSLPPPTQYSSIGSFFFGSLVSCHVRLYSPCWTSDERYRTITFVYQICGHSTRPPHVSRTHLRGEHKMKLILYNMVVVQEDIERTHWNHVWLYFLLCYRALLRSFYDV
jgi:hypothetical protein